jgi:hypothetical protein
MGTTNLAPMPLMGVGTFGKSKNVTAQERTNLYVELTPNDPEKSVIAMYPTPGLDLMLTFGSSPIRGIYAVGVFRYAVHRNNFYKIANDNSYTNIGTLDTSSGRVDIADNGLQIMIVDGPNGYIWDLTTLTFSKITDVDFPGASTVTFMNGYFIISEPDSGRFYISAPYDGLTWNALDFATAESNPDNLVRVQANNGQLILYGDKTTEYWGDSGAQDFPFARIGAAAIEWGLAARWSLSKFMDAIIFLRKNRLGAVQVCVSDNGVAVPVSTPNLDYIFQQYMATSDATGFSYMVSGHPMYQINFPTVGESWTFDGMTKEWHRSKSGTGRHRAEIQYNHQDYSFVTDYEDGSIYRINPTSLTDNGSQVIREFISRHQTLNGNWTVFDEVWVEMEAGVGKTTGQGSDPIIMLQVSKDGGHTWGNEIWVPFGKIGEYRRRAVWRRLGRSRDWVFKFRVTDPVKTVFVAAWGRGGS